MDLEIKILKDKDNSKKIHIVSTPPKWTDMQNDCGYKQVRQNHRGGK